MFIHHVPERIQIKSYYDPHINHLHIFTQIIKQINSVSFFLKFTLIFLILERHGSHFYSQGLVKEMILNI